ncbi:hypothetical protein [Nocardia arthritidis]|uniref:Uncharacterized protein n=1 Tax=Nocardia arthritidis TaxID=228602 RepID=A0A6G9Y885_9NOCA|nr:hypothetical protein [Nocardia arthritidis]QIS09388.1 hypothetical protein F5544_07410 [Nocardia arthritidis]
MTESHVVIYCDFCGEHYTENGSESICFDSTHQAVTYLNARSAAVGWLYDGDKVWCDGCRAADTCVRNGHTYPQHAPRLYGFAACPRFCTRCGFPESTSEIKEIS